MQMDVCEALASFLRPLMKRLPRQTIALRADGATAILDTADVAYLAARLLNPKPD